MDKGVSTGSLQSLAFRLAPNSMSFSIKPGWHPLLTKRVQLTEPGNNAARSQATLEIIYYKHMTMAHNPTIEQHVEFCPCGCNANLAYTSVTTNPTTHECPKTDAEWNNWWMCKLSWEEPFLSRVQPALFGLLWKWQNCFKISISAWRKFWFTACYRSTRSVFQG